MEYEKPFKAEPEVLALFETFFYQPADFPIHLV